MGQLSKFNTELKDLRELKADNKLSNLRADGNKVMMWVLKVWMKI